MFKRASKHFFKSILLVIAAVVFIYVRGTQPATPATAGAAATQVATADETGQVVHVVDGDTIDVQIGSLISRVRLLGMNTPETVDPGKPVECYGPQASAETKSLLTDASVKLTSDPTQGDRDKYGRLLRYVYRSDGLFVNETLIQQGFAYEYTYDKAYAFQTDFKRDEVIAREQKVGLWADNTCAGQKTAPSTASTSTK